MKNFSETLREYIDTYSEGKVYIFAKDIGFSATSVYKWVSGESIPNIQKMIILAEYIQEISGIPYSYIIMQFVLGLEDSIAIMKRSIKV